MSDSLRPHEPQHARPLCPSSTPKAYLNSCPLSQWFHPTICHPLLLLPSIFPSTRVFTKELTLHIRWPKDWSFSFSISPSNEYSRLISFRIDWFDLLEVQGALKSLPQHPAQKHQFFITQTSLWFNFHPYMMIGKTMAVTWWTFASQVMSLLFNTLSRFAIALLPRSKHLLIS